MYKMEYTGTIKQENNHEVLKFLYGIFYSSQFIIVTLRIFAIEKS